MFTVPMLRKATIASAAGMFSRCRTLPERHRSTHLKRISTALQQVSQNLSLVIRQVR